jgi:hypothetical protein
MTIRFSRRTTTLLLAGLVSAAGLVPMSLQSASAAPAAPAGCYDFTDGTGTIDQTVLTNADGQALTGRLTFTARLAAPSCSGAIYTLSVQNVDGSVIEQVRRTGTGDQNTLTFTVDVPAASGTCVGIEGTTATAKGTVIDEAPDGAVRSATPAYTICTDSGGGQFWG